MVILLNLTVYKHISGCAKVIKVSNFKSPKGWI